MKKLIVLVACFVVVVVIVFAMVCPLIDLERQ